MVSEDRGLEEPDWDVNGLVFIVPHNWEVDDNTDDAEESETDSASDSENDDETEWERIMNLMIRIGDTISRARSPTP